jgi:hypothetical protein
MIDAPSQRDLLFAAELQFRLSSAVRLAVTNKIQPLNLPQIWSHGKHTVRYEEIALREDQADFAAHLIQSSATYLMAVAMNNAMESQIKDPENSKDPDIQGAYLISRLIRNAFAHGSGPFYPVWLVPRNWKNRILKVLDIISLDTTDLNGKPFHWKHYGGPLAILRLSQFVRFEILKAPRTKRKPFPEPKSIFYQQGSLILRKLD